MAAAGVQVERAASGAKSSAALDFLRAPKKLLIGGKWVPAEIGQDFRDDQSRPMKKCWR